jgi:hypothetical protein
MDCHDFKDEALIKNDMQPKKQMREVGSSKIYKMTITICFHLLQEMCSQNNEYGKHNRKFAKKKKGKRKHRKVSIHGNLSK